MASIINALSSGTGGIVTAGDASGILQLQTSNTAAVTIDGSQQVSIGSSTNYNGGGFGTNLSIYGSGSAATTYTKTGQQYQVGVNSAGNLGFYDPTHSTYMAALNQYGIGVGTAVPSSGFGIAFPATQSASSNANTLDDYEEGTWVPSIGSLTQTFTMTEYNGIYVKVGQMVTVVGIMSWSSKGSAASGDSLLIKNLPFTSNSDGNNTRMVGVFGISPATSTNWYNLWLYGGGGQTYITVTGKNSLTTASADLVVSDIQSSSSSRFSITYITN